MAKIITDSEINTLNTVVNAIGNLIVTANS
jgi:hypothetical protein